MSARQVRGVVVGSHGGHAKGLHAKASSLAGAADRVQVAAELERTAWYEQVTLRAFI